MLQLFAIINIRIGARVKYSKFLQTNAEPLNTISTFFKCIEFLHALRRIKLYHITSDQHLLYSFPILVCIYVYKIDCVSEELKLCHLMRIIGSESIVSSPVEESAIRYLMSDESCNWCECYNIILGFNKRASSAGPINVFANTWTFYWNISRN